MPIYRVQGKPIKYEGRLWSPGECLPSHWADKVSANEVEQRAAQGGVKMLGLEEAERCLAETERELAAANAALEAALADPAVKTVVMALVNTPTLEEQIRALGGEPTGDPETDAVLLEALSE